MKDLDLICNFYNEMISTTKRNDKIDILQKYKTCKEVFDLVAIIYNPFITFGVTSNNIITSMAEAHTTALLDLLNLLANRKISGNTALRMCRYTMMMNSKYESLLKAIFDKDLKIGVDVKTINKVWDDVIPVFNVALAFDINKSPTYRKRLDEDKYIITRKMDGVRLLAVFKDNDVKFYSRTGKEYYALKLLRNALLTAVSGMTDFVLDGELCVIDEGGNEDFIEAVSQVRRLNYTMDSPHYKVFDWISYAEFTGKTTSEKYSVRLNRAKDFFSKHPTPYASVLNGFSYSENTLTKAMEVASIKGYEGCILRADAPYKSGRTSDLLKCKIFKSTEIPMQDAEYQIEDITTTTKLMKGLSGTMEPTDCMGAVVIRHKGSPVKVGTGFSNAQRLDAYNNTDSWIGRTITVQYQEESVDRFGKPSLRIPSFKAFRDKFE